MPPQLSFDTICRNSLPVILGYMLLDFFKLYTQTKLQNCTYSILTYNCTSKEQSQILEKIKNRKFDWWYYLLCIERKLCLILEPFSSHSLYFMIFTFLANIEYSCRVTLNLELPDTFLWLILIIHSWQSVIVI